MKLLRLKLNSDFRSLQAGFEVHFLRDFEKGKVYDFTPYCLAGKNGSGKSNILEAISLLGGTFSTDTRKYLSEFIRYDRFEDLFYDKETSNSIYVGSNIGVSQIENEPGKSYFRYYLAADKLTLESLRKSTKSSISSIDLHGHQTFIPSFAKDISAEGNTVGSVGVEQWHTPIKKYDFKKYMDIKNRFHHFLLPADGSNLYAVVNNNKKFHSEISSFFKEYKLNFVLKRETTEFSLQKNVKGVVYEYKYNLIADTLQRIIFYLMAIGSNKESVLIFEEPETHSFPRYTKLLAEKIIASKENQFFVSTHSPFILNTIIENAPLEDVAVFVASYENFQTKVKPLSKRELEDMLNYGNDIFFSDKLNG